MPIEIWLTYALEFEAKYIKNCCVLHITVYIKSVA